MQAELIILGHPVVFKIKERMEFKHKCGYVYNSYNKLLKYDGLPFIVKIIYDLRSDKDYSDCPNCNIEYDVDPLLFNKYNILIEGNFDSNTNTLECTVIQDQVLIVVSAEEIENI